ncbi:hypothetical protein BHE90_009640 [Fusarium euwallaceae]|uniref:60S ribosomal protein L33-A n=2 Tax=Fusarium solani species complex TaxID=232080 RepID=A0A3M2RZQ5_9HYPO|nr:hypothetical protein CDV36_009584 [Fusarium kuroshium]RSL63497.1 hypothetical protein CEP53_004387 [Fusarium sp. AF-6]RTE75912.1 hypothetical protein BHE90_009640 [Fusarium euwallaceae]
MATAQSFRATDGAHHTASTPPQPDHKITNDAHQQHGTVFLLRQFPTNPQVAEARTQSRCLRKPVTDYTSSEYSSIRLLACARRDFVLDPPSTPISKFRYRNLAKPRHNTNTIGFWTDDDGYRGRHLSYQRSRHTTRPATSLIKIEGVDDTKGANFYLGKKVAFVYRGQKEIRGTKIRVIWGKVTRPHGNSGVVRAKFTSPLPTKSFGASVRVMLYPSSI